MTLYRKKSVTVKAWQYTGQPREEWPGWVKGSYDWLSQASVGTWVFEDGDDVMMVTNDYFVSAYEPITTPIDLNDPWVEQALERGDL